MKLKYKAFTLAELMILIAILTVLFAAFAPVFTVRYNNASSDYVWSFIQEDTQYDSYSDVLNKSLPAEFFVGITPTRANEISDSNYYAPYSKLVIRASNVLSSGTKQAQMDFRYNKTNSGGGILVGSLFAGDNNMLVGGPFRSIEESAIGNTAFGERALNSITTGNYNTAVGYNSLNILKSGSDNTVIGADAGTEHETSNNNTYIGYGAGNKVTGSSNTAIGYNALNKGNSFNTFVGHSSGEKMEQGYYNTSLGYRSLYKLATGEGNVAVGARSLDNLESGGYNTAVGADSCSAFQKGSYKTCIGADSGSEVSINKSSDNTERVLIGKLPSYYDNNKYTNAILEVHNVSTKHVPFQRSSSRDAIMGDSSVIVNGNLVIRGQTFMMGDSDMMKDSYPSLMGFYIASPKASTRANIVMGADGNDRTDSTLGEVMGLINDKYERRHKKKGGHINCVCARGGRDYYNGDKLNGVISYDWSSPLINADKIREYSGGSVNRKMDFKTQYSSYRSNYPTPSVQDSDFRNSPYANFLYGKGYLDMSTGYTLGDTEYSHESLDIDLNKAHNYYDNFGVFSEGGVRSCCPVLNDISQSRIVSDARLKNIGEKFTGGLEQIRKINIYNFTYKNDKFRIPQVGVIAQDLKRIFPNAVTKDENGYYKIRWDEIFYSAINSIKELNTKIENLASKIQSDKERINSLKKDNEQLQKQLNELSNELSALEK